MFPDRLPFLQKSPQTLFGVFGGHELVEVDLLDVSEGVFEGKVDDVRDCSTRVAKDGER